MDGSCSLLEGADSCLPAPKLATGHGLGGLPRDKLHCALQGLKERLHQLSAPTSPFGRQVAEVAEAEARMLSRDSGDCAGGAESLTLELGRRLAAAGHDTLLRHAGGAKGDADYLRALRHAFLVVRGSGDYTGIEVLVEPGLRQHFVIPHPTPEYADVLAAVPDVFVGGSCRLVPIVQLLCALMADSFERQGLALPPWRREGAMLSKWLPQPHRMRDARIPAPPPPLPAAQKAAGEAAASSSPAAAAGAAEASGSLPDCTTVLLQRADSATSTSSTSSTSSSTEMCFSSSPISVLAPWPAALASATSPAPTPKPCDAVAFRTVRGFRTHTQAAEAGASLPSPGGSNHRRSSGGGGIGRSSASLLADKLKECEGGCRAADVAVQTRQPGHPGLPAIRVVKPAGARVLGMVNDAAAPSGPSQWHRRR